MKCVMFWGFFWIWPLVHALRGLGVFRAKTGGGEGGPKKLILRNSGGTFFPSFNFVSGGGFAMACHRLRSSLIFSSQFNVLSSLSQSFLTVVSFIIVVFLCLPRHFTLLPLVHLIADIFCGFLF